jgi:hypothetical protein
MLDVNKIIEQTEFLNQYDTMDLCPICQGKTQDIFDLETPACSICKGWGKIPKGGTN